MTIRKSATVLVAGILIASLAGCTSAASGGAPTSSPSVDPSPSEAPGEPSPSPQADAADPSTWVISAEAVGPIEIGGDFAAALGELPGSWTNDANCSWSAWWNAEDASHGIFFVRGTESETSPISEISVYTAVETPAPVDGPMTAEGLGVGASREEILAAYPDAQEGTAQIGGGTWIRLASDGDAHVFFEFQDGVQTASDVVVTTRSEPSYEVCG